MMKIHDIEFIDVGKIIVNDWNPNEMKEREYERLTREIKNSGLISAIEVYPLEDGRYRVIDGEHRFRVARDLGYDEMPCVILDEEMFADKDVQKMETVKANMLTGNEDPEKFMSLVLEMKEKYGEEDLQDLFGYTDDDKWTMLTKELRRSLKDAGLSKDEIDNAMDQFEKDKSIENLSNILNNVFAENKDGLEKYGYMSFDFEGTKMHYVEVSREVYKAMDEIQIDTPPQELKQKLVEVLTPNE